MADTGKTTRLFERNSKKTFFKARVIGCEKREKTYAVELDQTLFYPTSGGQPHDTGTLNEIPVLDVTEQDETIYHITETNIATETEVEGCIDWDRRFDHMQQHSGQHLLSRCFYKNLKAETIGFHLGKTVSTIDLSVSEIQDDMLDCVETETNRIIFSNQDVKIHNLTLDESRKLDLRKEPSVDGMVRVVSIADFDHSACCGTHVHHSGEIGILKIIHKERYKGGIRVTFLCGGRALKDYQLKDKAMREAGSILSAGESDIVDVLSRWRDERKQAAKTIKNLLEENLTREADKLVQDAHDTGKVKLVTRVFNSRERAHIQLLTRKTAALGGVVALFGTTDKTGHVFFAVSPDIQLDIRPFLKKACDSLEGRGGGSASFAQASCLRTDQMQSVLESIQADILKSV